MTNECRQVCAEVTYRAPGWQGMVMQLEDTANKIERMRQKVAAAAGCSVAEVECVLDDDLPVLHIRARGMDRSKYCVDMTV